MIGNVHDEGELDGNNVQELKREIEGLKSAVQALKDAEAARSSVENINKRAKRGSARKEIDPGCSVSR